MELTLEQLKLLDRNLTEADSEYAALMAERDTARRAELISLLAGVRTDLASACPPEGDVQFGNEKRGLYHCAESTYIIREPLEGYKVLTAPDGRVFPLEYKSAQLEPNGPILRIA